MTRLGRIAIAAVLALPLAAAPSAAAGKGKTSVAQSHTGCLQKGTEPNTFTLTNIAGKGPKTVEIVESANGVNLAAHVGHKVTITGTSLSAKAAAKAEGTKNVKAERREHHMRAETLTMVSTTCP